MKQKCEILFDGLFGAQNYPSHLCIRENKPKNSITMEVKKSPKASLENKRLLFTEIGLVVALGIVYLGFNYSSKDAKVAVLEDTTQVVIEEEMIAIQNDRPPPPPEAPSIPVLSDQIDIVDDDIKLDDGYKRILTKGLCINGAYKYTDVDHLLKDLQNPNKVEEEPQQSRQQERTNQQSGNNSCDEERQATEAKVEIQKGKGNGFKDIAGMDQLKQMLTKKVIFILKDKEKAEKYKLLPPNGMLFYGPPGCGKSFFAEKFAEETGFNFMLVKAFFAKSRQIL